MNSTNMSYKIPLLLLFSMLSVTVSTFGFLGFKAVNFHNDLVNERFVCENALQKLEQYRLDHPFKYWLTTHVTWFDVGSLVGYHEPDIEMACESTFRGQLESSDFLKFTEGILEKAFGDDSVLAYNLATSFLVKFGFWVQNHWSLLLAPSIVLGFALMYFKDDEKVQTDDKSTENASEEQQPVGVRNCLVSIACALSGEVILRSTLSYLMGPASTTNTPEHCAEKIIVNASMMCFYYWMYKYFGIGSVNRRKLNRNIVLFAALKCCEISLHKLEVSSGTIRLISFLTYLPSSEKESFIKIASALPYVVQDVISRLKLFFPASWI